jgi:hypothetical protein
MYGVYGFVLLIGAWFCYSALSADPIEYKSAVQAIIFLGLGTGGLLMNRERG